MVKQLFPIVVHSLFGDDYHGGADFNNGYGIGASIPLFSSQGLLAIDFYTGVVKSLSGVNAQNISLAGILLVVA